MARLLEEIKEIVDFMRDNGVLELTEGDRKLVLHPSALEVAGDSWTSEAGSTPTYRDVYDDPMLYPDGKDPVAEQKDWLKKTREGRS